MNSLFFLCAHLAGASETGSSGDGEHGGAPSHVESFSYFIPATHNRVSVSFISDLSSSTNITPTSTLPCPGVQRVKELLCDVDGIPRHCDQRAQTFWKKRSKYSLIIENEPGKLPDTEVQSQSRKEEQSRTIDFEKQ